MNCPNCGIECHADEYECPVCGWELGFETHSFEDDDDDYVCGCPYCDCTVSTPQGELCEDCYAGRHEIAPF